MFCIAFTFSGSREIPLELMTNPRNFPVDTSKKDLVGFIFSWCRLSQVSKMISLAAAFDGNVIHITLDRLAYVGPKDFVHCPLVGRSSILQTKRHDRIAIDSQRCPERGVLFIGREHLNLIVPRESIHKGHALEATCVINHDIRNWQGKLIFRASIIEIPKVNANPDFTIPLGDWNDIRYPIRMLFFPDKTRIDKLLNFSLDCLHHGWAEPSLRLFEWLLFRVDV